MSTRTLTKSTSEQRAKGDKPKALKQVRRVLTGATLRPEWLAAAVPVLAVRFAGPLRDALTAAQSREYALPTGRLRITLLRALCNPVHVDPRLGCNDKPRDVAIECLASSVASPAALTTLILRALQRWRMDVLEPLATRSADPEAITRIHRFIDPRWIEVRALDRPLIEPRSEHSPGEPNYRLIAHQLGCLLNGQTLYPGLGPSIIHAEGDPRSGCIELVTRPAPAHNGKGTFSMVARLAVATWPVGDDVHLRITPSKRNWSAQPPAPKSNAPRTFRAHVYAPDQPIVATTVRRVGREWLFGDEYQEFLADSRGQLPDTPVEACQRAGALDLPWWTGIPELPRLHDRIRQRSVLEIDEIDLVDRLLECLPEVLAPVQLRSPGIVPRAQDPLRAPSAPPETLHRVTLTHLTAAAEGSRTAADDRLATHLEANREALMRIHGDIRPSLWVVADGEPEIRLIRETVRLLFGERVVVRFERLPCGVHGTREGMDVADRVHPKARFEQRVDRWATLAKAITESGLPARHALVCVSDRVGTQREDFVNRRAGRHALSAQAGANVQYLLPIERGPAGREGEAEEKFVYRVHSALLDLFFGHAGYILPGNALARLVTPTFAPGAIHGIQVLVSRRQANKQDEGNALIVCSRLDPASGTTMTRLIGQGGSGRKVDSAWLPMSQALRWLGAQRHLTGDQKWLRNAFKAHVRELLNDLYNREPNPLVLVDWDSISGYWSDISDQRLRERGHPRLEDTNLATAMPNMTLLRLRARRDTTMAERRQTTLTFPAPLGALPGTGETVVRQGTTVDSIIELTPPGAKSTLRHYLLTMGRSATAQGNRAVSCWRNSRVMDPTGLPGLRPPTTKDVAVPRGLEVTVLQQPAGLDPNALMQSLMQLRRGYAHYSDWTALPAPLSFIDKLRDYVVHYHEDEEEQDDGA
jgi:hypothetical protein